MATYKNTDVYEMMTDLYSLRQRWLALGYAFMGFDFKNERAREFADHGFMRRVKIMIHCAETVFQKLPPDATEIPGDDEVINAETALHAFLINCFGCIDNLAWILVEELPIKEKDGGELPAARIGLQPKCKEVKAALSEDFRTKLEGLGVWFNEMGRFRDALAHRISPYIPPHCVAPENTEEYKRIDEEIKAILGECFVKMEQINSVQKGTGMERAKRIDQIIEEKNVKAGKLEVRQKSLCHFMPLAAHSLRKESSYMYVHPQLICDFMTIELLGNCVMRELETNKRKNNQAGS